MRLIFKTHMILIKKTSSFIDAHHQIRTNDFKNKNRRVNFSTTKMQQNKNLKFQFVSHTLVET